ncbi:apical junction component 1 homolog [Paramormyrops kingsleyae]|uniref:Apical junction component 1 homolog n=1 Tax=Paramormyrops kingsleyae TaxID=1676925 RepID=A0A3B3S0C4_9TELE|nr:uncharacterized protein C9orf172 homolog [Paramormyrops kingsleyae]
MTRTDRPDILVSTVYADIDVNPTCVDLKISPPPAQCDYRIRNTTEDKLEKNNKRFCRSFDFIESLDDPETLTSSMEYPYRRTDRHVVHQDIPWNALGQQGHLRFSSPDLFNTRLPAQLVGSENIGEPAAWSNDNRRARSKSAPRVKTTLTPVHFEASPPMARRGREVHRGSQDPTRRSELSPRRETSSTTNRAFVNEVHPIKLQPQGSDARRYSPLYIPDRFEESRPATSPHVRCRVDIKPDEAVLQHTAWKSMPRSEVPWQRYSSGGSRSLTVPRQVPSSRTPTPTDSLSGEYRYPYLYSNYLPNNYIQPFEVAMQRMPSPTESRGYFGRERRAHSSPNVPARFYYADDPGIYTPRTYYQEDPYGIPSQNYMSKVQYVQNPRMVHTVPSRPYYTDMDPYPYPLSPVYPKNYSPNDLGPDFIQTSPSQSYYEDDPKSYSIQTTPSKIFYANESFMSSPEHHILSRGYQTEGRRRPRLSQPSDDWYDSNISSYATFHPSAHTPQYTSPKTRQDPMLTPWYGDSYVEPARLGADTRLYSKSWDNILNPRIEREHPVHRGRSYENLLYHDKRTLSPDDRRQPVVVNLSSSPRRYAALSLSENSLTDRSPSDGGRSTMSKFWFVTPEITITDNDLRASNLNKTEVRSASWDVLDSGTSISPEASKHESMSCSVESTKGKIHNSSSLQQSLEQLDELLADLVIDYKPPVSRRPSEDLLDQLKKLINDDETKEDSSKEGSKESEDSTLLNKEPTLAKMTSDVIKDIDGSSDQLQRSTEEFSPEHSPDEDGTMTCSNNKCQRTDTLFNACLYFKSCHSCYTYYCSRNCRREDWDMHKECCLYGRITSVCRNVLKYCRETGEVHKAFSRIAKVGYLSRGRGILFLGFPNPGSSKNFLKFGLESLLMSPTYLSLRELDSFKENLGEYCKELQSVGNEYDPCECFLLNVSIAVGDQVPDGPSPRVQAPAVRKYAKVALASCSPEKTRNVSRKENDMETLILTPPPGTTDIDKEGEEGQKAREICFINIQRELRTRGVFLRHEYPDVYQQLCEFVESNKRFTPTTIYPIDKRTGKQFMCMIMAASEPRTLDWLGTPNLLDDII